MAGDAGVAGRPGIPPLAAPAAATVAGGCAAPAGSGASAGVVREVGDAGTAGEAGAPATREAGVAGTAGVADSCGGPDIGALTGGTRRASETSTATAGPLTDEASEPFAGAETGPIADDTPGSVTATSGGGPGAIVEHAGGTIPDRDVTVIADDGGCSGEPVSPAVSGAA
jgi:hypothetical protein